MSTTQLAAKLYRLQQLDLELDRLKSEQRAVSTALQGDNSLKRLRAEYATAQQQLQASTQARKEAEWALEDVNNRLKTQEQRLYSASGNSRDLQSLQQEVQRLKAQQSRQEERVLEVLDQEEAARELLQRKEKVLQQTEDEWKEQTAALVARSDQIEARIQEVQQQRTTHVDLLDSDNVKRYETMRRTKQGRAVSRVEQNACQWCLVILTPSELQRVRINAEIQTCSNCGRILFFERG